MGASVNRFKDNPEGNIHSAYEASMLFPVAPEQTTGEVLLAAAYRTLVLNERDAVVDLQNLDGLADRLAAEATLIDERVDVNEFRQTWQLLTLASGGLASPSTRNQSPRLRHLMPLVPELSRVSGVLGKVRSRWQPGNLLVSTIYSGKGPERGFELILRLRSALSVGPEDDYFARFIENTLSQSRDDTITPRHTRPVRPTDDSLRAMVTRYLPAWRNSNPHQGYLPSERFTRDLEHVIEMKSILTRRQWAVLIESLLRLGLSMHQMWLSRLNTRIWRHCLAAVDENELASLEQIGTTCWPGQDTDEPFFHLGEDAKPQLDRILQEFGLARIGINLILWALEDAGCAWPSEQKLGAPTPELNNPPAATHWFLEYVWTHREDILRSLSDWGSLKEAAFAVADNDPRYLSGAATRNLSFFLRYALSQLDATTQRQYDQSYMLYRRDKGSRVMVQPAPSTLALLVHCSCRDSGAVPASMTHFQQQLLSYGIASSAEELRSGLTARDLERLGLVVDSPDAGGGRLLVDPFFKEVRAH